MNYNEKFDLLTEKYRPSKIKDLILPDRIIAQLKSIIKSKAMPHLLLSGQRGIGKTTIALALANELNSEVLFINASKDRGIDVLRNDIAEFATGLSIDGSQRIIILDESDQMTDLTQHSLRGVMEDKKVLANCRFILTCNHVNKVIPEIQSRCSRINFDYDKVELFEVIKKFIFRSQEILKNENVKFTQSTIIKIIGKHAPDFRSVLNEFELNISDNVLSEEINSGISNDYIKDLAEWIIKLNFGSLHTWAFENPNISFSSLMMPLYKELEKHIVKDYIPILIEEMAKTDVAIASATNESIQIVAFFIAVMKSCEFEKK